MLCSNLHEKEIVRLIHCCTAETQQHCTANVTHTTPSPTRQKQKRKDKEIYSMCNDGDEYYGFWKTIHGAHADIQLRFKIQLQCLCGFSTVEFRNDLMEELCYHCAQSLRGKFMEV